MVILNEEGGLRSRVGGGKPIREGEKRDCRDYFCARLTTRPRILSKLHQPLQYRIEYNAPDIRAYKQSGVYFFASEELRTSFIDNALVPFFFFFFIDNIEKFLLVYDAKRKVNNRDSLRRSTRACSTNLIGCVSPIRRRP